MGAEDIKSPFVQPHANLAAQARPGVSNDEHEAFFQKMLGDVEEGTAPFGLTHPQGDESRIEEKGMRLDPDLSRRIQMAARKLGVSTASVCHVGWAQVLSRLTGREDVVFGTVLFGRMQGGEEADQTIGSYTNILPVRMQVGADTVAESIKKMHVLLANLMRHDQTSLALAQRCSGVLAPGPLFTSLLNYRHNPEAAQTHSAEAQPDFPFVLSVEQTGNVLELRAQTPGTIGALRICEYMRKALEGLAEALESEPTKAVGSIDILPESERNRLLYEWNDTKREYPADKCLHELFEEQVERTPDAIAVAHQGKELTYRELNARANRLSYYLKELGVGPDRRVGICVERGFEMVVGVFAVLKAGGTYVPMDPKYPAERLRYMLEDSAPAVLLTRGESRELLGAAEERLPVIDLGSDEWRRGSRPEENPERGNLAVTDLAYVIYTSGSTGLPKGAMIEHRGVVNYLTWALGMYGPVKRSYVSSSLSFDSTVLSLYSPLLCGGVARLISAGEEVEGLCEEISQRSGLVIITPSHLESLGQKIAAERGRSLANVFVIAGEQLSMSTVQLWRQIQRDVRMVNEYGPTETAVGCIAYDIPIETDGSKAAPIGAPIANARVYILDTHGEPTPVGVEGELYIGGVGVGRGYLNREELTAARFMKDPFAAEEGARMYRTGDLGRWRPDGIIEFIGRNDFQVKIRGFRIELGEIETILCQHPAVKQAAVVVRQNSEGEKRLVAYVVPHNQQPPAISALRDYLRRKLPNYMIPAGFACLAALPLTANGKIDRLALSARDIEVQDQGAVSLPPRTQTEQILSGIWQEVLRVDRVGINDSFLDIGGNSLLATRIVARIRKAFAVELPLRLFFETPTITGLSEEIASLQKMHKPAPDAALSRAHLASQASNARPDGTLALKKFSPEKGRMHALRRSGKA